MTYIGGHPNEKMRRMERTIVQAIADEYSKGEQSQVTTREKVEIAAGGVLITITPLESDV